MGKVKVYLQNHDKLICEAEVESLSNHYLTCIFYLILKNSKFKKVILKFDLTPYKSENITLTKELTENYTQIESVEVMKSNELYIY